jgi:probable rRNA maturation factor
MPKMDLKKIQFHYLEKSPNIPARTHLKDFILKIFKKEGFKVGTVNYIFCSDNYLFDLNRTFLNHNTYTDIITFQYSTSSESIISDIYISLDRVRENARLFQSTFVRELHRVMFHGALHLCGYKDKTKSNRLQMRSMEDFYLEKMFHVKKRTRKS